MTKIKIATWNVNSLRVRLPQLLEWLALNQPDILALQEIKLQDADFPLDAIKEAGYEAHVSGQKAYNGVALLTRVQGGDRLTDFPGFVDPQRRVLALTIGDLRIVNLYVPNGESVDSDKFLYKLSWLEALHGFLQQELAKHAKLIVLGDLNIAPEVADVYDPLFWQGKVLFSEPERTALQNILQLGLHDCFRLHPQPDQSFSWWDYRLNAFKRNLGMRIDHILASHSLKQTCTNCYIDKSLRSKERPSDHALVVAEFLI